MNNDERTIREMEKRIRRMATRIWREINQPLVPASPTPKTPFRVGSRLSTKKTAA
jgi:hypothetical protein